MSLCCRSNESKGEHAQAKQSGGVMRPIEVLVRLQGASFRMKLHPVEVPVPKLCMLTAGQASLCNAECQSGSHMKLMTLCQACMAAAWFASCPAFVQPLILPMQSSGASHQISLHSPRLTASCFDLHCYRYG